MYIFIYITYYICIYGARGGDVRARALTRTYRVYDLWPFSSVNFRKSLTRWHPNPKGYESERPILWGYTERIWYSYDIHIILYTLDIFYVRYTWAWGPKWLVLSYNCIVCVAWRFIVETMFAGVAQLTIFLNNMRKIIVEQPHGFNLISISPRSLLWICIYLCRKNVVGCFTESLTTHNCIY